MDYILFHLCVRFLFDDCTYHKLMNIDSIVTDYVQSIVQIPFAYSCISSAIAETERLISSHR